MGLPAGGVVQAKHVAMMMTAGNGPVARIIATLF